MILSDISRQLYNTKIIIVLQEHERCPVQLALDLGNISPWYQDSSVMENL